MLDTSRLNASSLSSLYCENSFKDTEPSTSLFVFDSNRTAPTIDTYYFLSADISSSQYPFYFCSVPALRFVDTWERKVVNAFVYVGNDGKK